MRCVAQIPRRLLPDTATVRLCGDDGEYGDAVELVGVRLEFEQASSDDEHRSADAGGGLLFVDAVTTDGAFEVPAGSRVDVGGASYHVRECRRYEAARGVTHHWELVLS